MRTQWGFTTRAIHGGAIPDTHRAVAPPIYQTATFSYETAAEGARLGQEIPPGYVYTRWGNPTTRALEEKVALLEGGEDALAAASGMGAIAATLLAALRPGDHAVAPTAIYQASYQLFSDVLPSFGIQTTLIAEPTTEAYERALRPTTRLLFIETPSNPMLGITDIAAVAALGRERGALTVADNTWATPYNQTPLALGVDVVVHSATKYLGGHHDVTAGVIVASREFIARAKRWVRLLGATPDPFGSWLVIRGLATLALRVERQNQTAQQLAEFLAAHPAVARVYYPGLPDHPGHAVARRQMRGFGGMLSFEVAGGYEASVRVFDALRVCTRATSLGGVSTLVSHPASISSVHMPARVREAAGIAPGLIRVSVGIEDPSDLLEDFSQALRRI
ncbi:MAG: aminotransferase class I/II-fold pyridoxal phosphate-dependent enzyme [Armatimonadota bacterium]|nr:aminotransferase class I/II-fold pyridoxal phosphate-dependent enzyme [Armatimonadota bacterium]MDR7436275.1 aminotransferase class I/II-fold pyridoxal phosphate-dependent enzyme [Armatimonadota bacterium]MDR7471345.1 aminotransferase class I/II-fold pyridoxal phosphate-dependent enzyme [Armatimonadota bacterium]MDR7506443.1 aminotransferase class I/II-fold pyridoxal phosphate-dependent enzyme [Armatimonadota bacterium]MDR7508998.1 aminotransferase class I/II-fold pyridoxal phosphate-depende